RGPTPRGNHTAVRLRGRQADRARGGGRPGPGRGGAIPGRGEPAVVGGLAGCRGGPHRHGWTLALTDRAGELADALAGRAAQDEQAAALAARLADDQEQLEFLAAAHGRLEIDAREWMAARKPVLERI